MARRGSQYRLTGGSYRLGATDQGGSGDCVGALSSNQKVIRRGMPHSKRGVSSHVDGRTPAEIPDARTGMPRGRGPVGDSCSTVLSSAWWLQGQLCLCPRWTNSSNHRSRQASPTPGPCKPYVRWIHIGDIITFFAFAELQWHDMSLLFLCRKGDKD